MGRYSYGYGDYETVAEKKAKAQKKLKKFQKSHPDAVPITIPGTKIASSFWGKAWCDNLKIYADYDNRISRGRSYIKNGFVFDLTINAGQISGVVCGSGSKLYHVSIGIEPITDDRLIRQINGSIESLEELIEGKFPKELAQTFLTKENGLFPDLKEVHLDCDCPDWAHMCKHVSAILYAVGTKLDANPLLLFELRGINTKDLIQKSVDEKLETLLKNATNTKSTRTIDEELTQDLFDL